MEKLSRFSVRQPVTIMMIMLAVILLGVISFQRLGVEILPDLKNPSLYIELDAGERPPEEIENLFVDRIESLISRLSGVIEVSSRIRTGSALITVQYSWDTDMDGAFLDLQKSMSDATQNLEIDEISITDYDPNSLPVMTIALFHPDIKDMDELRKTAENYIRNELIRLDGVADVKVYGAEEKEVVVQTSRYLLDAFGVTADEVASRIKSYSQNISGGSVQEMGLRYVVKGISVFQSLDDIKNLVISYRDNAGADTQDELEEVEKSPVFLKDLAEVRQLNREPENIAYINGERCLGLGIYKETRYNTVKAVKTLSARMKDIEKALPGFRLVVVDDQADYINSAVREVEQTALIGIVLAVIVLFVFLRRIGTTAIISVSIPVCVLATFTLMYFKGLTLNIMTLGGLALGAGMLVDNAIVVVESIVRNIESGMDVRKAAVSGTAQVSGAITAATITTVVVFLPIVYIHGVAGELFRDQALTVAFALLSSLVVAILFIPMLSVKTLKESGGPGPAAGARFSRYGVFLERVLEKRWLVISLAFTLVAVTALLIPVVGSEFIPDTDINEFSLNVTLPPGTSLERTASTSRKIEEIAEGILGEAVLTIYSVAGPLEEAGAMTPGVFQDRNTASIKITLKKNLESGSRDLIGALSEALEGLPGIEVQLVDDQSALKSIIGTESAPVEVEIAGDDLDSLKSATERIYTALDREKYLHNVKTTFEKGRPEIEVHIDRLRAGLYGIGIEDIASQLENRLTGREAGSWDRKGDKMDITLRFPETTPAQLSDFTLIKGGREIALADIASIQAGYSPDEINRRNQKRTGTVSAYYGDDMKFDRVIDRVRKIVEGIGLPPGYGTEIRGEEQKRRESFGQLKFALILSVVLVYMVLASQFESLSHPFTILLTIPLAGVGAVLIFLVLARPLNIMAYIGIIMLAGIAVNDSIILVDTINRLKRAGSGKKAAIVQAGRQRIRPIIMTSVTTILALLPLTFGFGEGAALRSPMALAVIGGLLTSTLLTLIVIPAVYYVMDRGE